jgi:N-acetylneuraminic acid mutarotase
MWKYDPLTNQWAWMNGPNLILQTGVYGTLGVSSPSNYPGARYGSTAWTDASGNLWLFGGYGLGPVTGQGNLNDLWKYNVTSNEWTWMGGTNSIWGGGSYGAQGVPSATNMPGARSLASGWVDGSGKLYLFGGTGCTTNSMTVGRLDDIWSYNTSNGEWTWLKGNNNVNQNGVYGTLGSASPSNNPGGRAGANVWRDNSGNIWVFGGDGLAATGTVSALLNDLWKYDMSSGDWTWIRGSMLGNQTGTYSASPANLNNPGGRYGAVTWKDVADNLWMFGGMSVAATNATGEINDLWRYDIALDTWTWMRGNTANFQNGSYGSQGNYTSSNIPGARNLFNGWIDAKNNLWLFGGVGYGASGPSGKLNDMWVYRNCVLAALEPQLATNRPLICAGETATLTASGATSFDWGNSITGTVQVVTLTVSTNYTVTTTNSNSCIYTATLTQAVDACTGLSAQASAGPSVFPNPSNGSFSIRLQDGGSASANIYSMEGRLIKEIAIHDSETVESGLAEGVYCIRITTGSATYSRRLVIQ